MAPMYALAPISWLVILMLLVNEAQQQPMKLLTRSSDAAALCAVDDPTLNTEMSQEIPGAPDVVRCAMTCTSYGGCKHFNYVSTESKPCQLYNYRPTNFDVSPNCQHYYQPDKHGTFHFALFLAVIYNFFYRISLNFFRICILQSGNLS